jgi:UPF0148 protein
MNRAGKDRMKVAVELVRGGATMLAEPCQQCGGVQVRYRGKTRCTSHEDLSALLKMEPVSYDSVVAGVREQLLMKLNEATILLEKEKDVAKQDQLVSLMVKYFELLQRTGKKQESS